MIRTQSTKYDKHQQQKKRRKAKNDIYEVYMCMIQHFYFTNEVFACPVRACSYPFSSSTAPAAVSNSLLFYIYQ